MMHEQQTSRPKKSSTFFWGNNFSGLNLYNFKIIIFILTIFYSANNLFADIRIGKNCGYTIVVAKDANSVTKFAACELMKYIEKVTGEKLVIKNDADNIIYKNKLILVGKSAYTKQLDVKFDDAVPEAFLIKSIGDNIIFLGDDLPRGEGNSKIPFSYFFSRKGTVFAVYDFLEKFAGVYWLFPGENGEVVPKKDILAIPDIDFKDHPDTEARWFWSSSRKLPGHFNVSESSKAESALWLMRIRQGVPLKLGFGNGWSHCWSTIMEGNKHYKEHPEYYPLVNGVRQKMWEHENGSPNDQGPLVCTSNPDVVKLFAGKITSRYKPGDDHFVSIMPNDGAVFCECINCKKLDHPELYNSDDGYTGLVYSDRIYTFVNAVAKEVKRTHPKLKLGLLAYTYYNPPPKTLDCLEDNICIKFVEQAELFEVNEAYRLKMKTNIDAWTKLSKPIMLSQHYDDQNRVPVSFFTSMIIQNTKRLQAHNIQSFSMEMHAFMPCRFFDYNLLSRMLWDRDLDTEKFMNDYFNRSYLEAERVMREYYEFMNTNFTNRYKESKRPAVSGNIYNLWLPEDIAKGYKILEKAKSLAQSDDVRKKIEFVENGHKFIELFQRLSKLCNEMVNSGCIMKMRLSVDRLEAPYKKNLSEQELNDLSKKAFVAYKKLYEFLKEHSNEPGMDPTIFWSNALSEGYPQAIEIFYEFAQGNTKNIFNNNFENAKAEGWQISNKIPLNKMIYKEEKSVGSSLLLDAPKDNITHLSRSFAAKPGQRYVFGIRYKELKANRENLDKGNGDSVQWKYGPTIKIQFHSSTCGYLQPHHGEGCRPLFIKNQYTVDSNEWVKLRFTFTVPEKVNADSFIINIMTPVGKWLIDDIFLEMVKENQ